MPSDNAEYGDSRNDTGGAGDTLRPMEALDPDDVRNADGDEVVDPPDDWVAADAISEEPEGESLDDKLAAEEPEPTGVEAVGNQETKDGDSLSRSSSRS